MKRFLPLLLASALVLVAGAAFAQPYYAPGSYQGWTLPENAPQLVDDGTNGDVAPGDGIYSRVVNIPAAGAYEWKAAIAGWASSWPGSGNCWFITTSDNEDVLLTFDTNAYGDGEAPDSMWPHSDKTRGATYTLVGNIGDELGGNDWDPAGSLFMVDDGSNGDMMGGDGIYTFCGNVALAGTYEWKVAVNGGWAQQFGTDGPSVNAGTWFVTVDFDNDPWCFQLDVNTGRIQAYPNQPVPVQNATWGAIKQLHD